MTSVHPVELTRKVSFHGKQRRDDMKTKVPKLPSLLERKIFKTGQTRGADDDEIFQNRVARNSTVLIPYSEWDDSLMSEKFENGYIVLIPPQMISQAKDLSKKGLTIGRNALWFYETRSDWDKYDPVKAGLKPATSRIAPLKGQFVARIPATTALIGGKKINLGFTKTSMKGAGIRFYEYASKQCILDSRLQLEAQFWLCQDSIPAAIAGGMSRNDAKERKAMMLQTCKHKGLLDFDKLKARRIVDKANTTICPFCLKRLSGMGFMTRMAQMHGREVPDLTITEISLFHIDELRPGTFNHRPYNLGWGHHHCNVVVKDAGIFPTLKWLVAIIKRNRSAGVAI